MINQRGQAFSVFELMIAGVVAFAILMVLMQVIGGVLTGQDTDALSALSDAVSSASPSGQVSAGSFVLKKGVEVAAEDLASQTDLDSSSFIFTMGEFTSSDSIEAVYDPDGAGSYLRYVGSQPKKKIAASVICKQTNDDLLKAINRLDSSKVDVSTVGSDGCGNEGIVCCVIIPTKATS